LGFAQEKKLLGDLEMSESNDYTEEVLEESRKTEEALHELIEDENPQINKVLLEKQDGNKLTQ